MSATPAKAKKASKPKKPATHPKYSEMIAKAITALKERGGSSRQAILKHIMANFNVGKDANGVNAHLKMALKRGVASGALKQSKGTGASGSFRLGEKKVAAKKVKKAKKPKSPKKKAAKKPAGEKKPKAKKAAKPKKAKSPKKAAKPKKAKTPKKAAAKKASKPKAKKSPKKAAKKAAKK